MNEEQGEYFDWNFVKFSQDESNKSKRNMKENISRNIWQSSRKKLINTQVPYLIKHKSTTVQPNKTSTEDNFIITNNSSHNKQSLKERHIKLSKQFETEYSSRELNRSKKQTTTIVKKITDNIQSMIEKELHSSHIIFNTTAATKLSTTTSTATANFNNITSLTTEHEHLLNEEKMFHSNKKNNNIESDRKSRSRFSHRNSSRKNSKEKMNCCFVRSDRNNYYINDNNENDSYYLNNNVNGQNKFEEPLQPEQQPKTKEELYAEEFKRLLRKTHGPHYGKTSSMPQKGWKEKLNRMKNLGNYGSVFKQNKHKHEYSSIKPFSKTVFENRNINKREDQVLEKQKFFEPDKTCTKILISSEKELTMRKPRKKFPHARCYTTEVSYPKFYHPEAQVQDVEENNVFPQAIQFVNKKELKTKETHNISRKDVKILGNTTYLRKTLKEWKFEPWETEKTNR